MRDSERTRERETLNPEPWTDDGGRRADDGQRTDGGRSYWMRVIGYWEDKGGGRTTDGGQLIFGEFASAVVAGFQLGNSPLVDVETNYFELFREGYRQRQADVAEAEYTDLLFTGGKISKNRSVFFHGEK